MTISPRTRRWINTGLGVLLLASLARCVMNFGNAEGRIKAVCAQMTPGMPAAQVTALAQANDLGLGGAALRDDAVTPLPDKKSMGRNGCKVTLKGGLVQSSDYYFID